MENSTNLTADKIDLALRNRHSGESWAYFAELRTKTGYSGRFGYIDAYAAGLWESNKGFISYEIKVSKNDFKSDIEHFAKKQADALRNSTQFYYVCPHGLIDPNEVPELSGLMWVDDGGAKVKKVAPIRELPGGSLDVKFILSLLRAAAGTPNNRSVMLKYLGKDIGEEQLLQIAADAGKRRDARVIHSEALKEAAKTRIKARQIIVKVCEAIGRSGSDLDYMAVDQMADVLINGLKEKYVEMEQFRRISWSVKAIRQAVDELERLAINSNQ